MQQALWSSSCRSCRLLSAFSIELKGISNLFIHVNLVPTGSVIFNYQYDLSKYYPFINGLFLKPINKITDTFVSSATKLKLKV